MNSTFEIVTVTVCVVGALLSLTAYFRPGRVLRELGRTGATWLEHPDERSLAELPSEDALDAPIPRRPLRSRFL
jgi:hypothetical protein